MNSEIERAVIRVLRSRAAASVSLRELHTAVVAEVGPDAGSYARFRDEVNQRADLFVIVEPEDPLGESAAWPAALRAEYRAALVDAGCDVDPLVVLVGGLGDAGRTDLVAGRDVLSQIGASLVELVGPARRNPGLQRALVAAIAQAPEIERALAVESAAADPDPQAGTASRDGRRTDYGR